MNQRSYITNPKGHEWKLVSGTKRVDGMAFTAGEYHNGPRCINCGYGFCEHCQDVPTKPCDYQPKESLLLSVLSVGLLNPLRKLNQLNANQGEPSESHKTL